MRGNPIREIVPDQYYFELLSRGFLNDRAIRDYYLKKKFTQLKSDIPPRKIFKFLQNEFPYICEDTIRKIIYSRNGDASPDDQDSQNDTEFNLFLQRAVR